MQIFFLLQHFNLAIFLQDLDIRQQIPYWAWHLLIVDDRQYILLGVAFSAVLNLMRNKQI